MGGDLYVRYMFKNIVTYTSDGNNNPMKKETVPFKTAAFGGELVVNTLDERSIKVKIASRNTKWNKIKRIPKVDYPKRNMPNADLLIEIKVIIPKLFIRSLQNSTGCVIVNILKRAKD